MGQLFSKPQGSQEYLLQMKQRLVEMIEPRYELIGSLSGPGVLNHREVQQLHSIHCVFKRNEELINMMASKPDHLYQNFLCALENTGQTHVRNFILSQGNTNDQFGNDKPLSPLQLKEVYESLLFLEDNMDTSDHLLELLCKGNHITSQQNRHLMECQKSRRSSKLINIITRRSYADFLAFISCLYKTGQTRVGKFLEQGGVVVAYRALIETQNPEEAKSIYRRLLSWIKELLGKSSSCGPSDLVYKGIEVVGARAGSVHLYLWCRNNSARDVLENISNNNSLDQTMDNWFRTSLNSDDDICSVTLTHRTNDDTEAGYRSKGTAAMLNRIKEVQSSGWLWKDPDNRETVRPSAGNASQGAETALQRGSDGKQLAIEVGLCRSGSFMQREDDTRRTGTPSSNDMIRGQRFTRRDNTGLV